MRVERGCEEPIASSSLIALVARPGRNQGMMMMDVE